MSMNKRLLLTLVLIISFFGICRLNVLADDTCTEITEEKYCTPSRACRWNDSTNSCEDTFVANAPCEENSIKIVLRVFGYILLVTRVAVPLIIIGFGTFDIFKSVVDKDEKSLAKQFKQLGIRVLAGLIVFFIPNIVGFVFTASDKLNIIETNQYETCANCLLKPGSCSVQE